MHTGTHIYKKILSTGNDIHRTAINLKQDLRINVCAHVIVIWDNIFVHSPHLSYTFIILKLSQLLQEHPLLAWPLFIFLLALAFYLYPEDYARIHMQYLFWLTILFPYLYWLYSL